MKKILFLLISILITISLSEAYAVQSYAVSKSQAQTIVVKAEKTNFFTSKINKVKQFIKNLKPLYSQNMLLIGLLLILLGIVFIIAVNQVLGGVLTGAGLMLFIFALL